MRKKKFKKIKNREREKENTRIPIQFEPGKLDDKKVKHKFIDCCGEEDETTIMTQVYSEKREEELLIAIKDIGEAVDEYPLLPLKQEADQKELG